MITIEGRFDVDYASGTSKATASQQWVNGRLYVMPIYQFGSNPVDPTSVAGPSITFAKVPNSSRTADLGTDCHISLWVAVGNGNTEAVTLSFAESEVDGGYQVHEYSGAEVGNGGLDGVIQAVANNGSSSNPSLTLAALRDADSVAGTFLIESPQATITPTGSPTNFGGYGHGSPVSGNTNGHAKPNVTSVGWTLAPSSPWLAVAYEVVNAGSAPPAPENTVAPVISGTPMENEVLSCSTGTWTNSPSLSYQWQKDTAGNNTFADIVGATSNQYTLTAAEVDDNIRCVVTGTNGGGSADANSNTLGPVEADTMPDWETTKTLANASPEVHWLAIGDYIVSVYYDGSGNIRYRVSSDEGLTFGASVIVDSQAGNNDVMLNDPIAYDETTGRLHFLYGRNVDVVGVKPTLCHRYTDNPFSATPTFSGEHVIDNGSAHRNNSFYRVAMWANNGHVSIHYANIDIGPYTTDGLWRALSSNGGVSFGAASSVYTGTVVQAGEPNCYGLPDGTVVVSWYDDETNTNNAGDVWICRSADDGATWDAAPTKLTTGKGWGRTRICGDNGVWWIVGNKPWNSGSPNADVYSIHSTDNAQTFGAPVLRASHSSNDLEHPDVFIRGSFIGIIYVDFAPNPRPRSFIYSLDGGSTFSSPVNAITVSLNSGGDAPRILGTTNYLIAKGWDDVAGNIVWSRLLLPASPPGQAPIVSAGTGWTKRKLNLSSTGVDPRNQSSEYKIASTTDPVTATFDLDESAPATVAIVAYKAAEAGAEPVFSGWGIPI